MLRVKGLQPDKFLCARDLFCAAADAADEAQAIEQALERARTRERSTRKATASIHRVAFETLCSQQMRVCS